MLSQIISISDFPDYLLFFPSMVKMWPSSLLILAVLACLGTWSCCLSPHQCQTPHPCFLYLFLLLVPSSSFQFLCSAPHIRFTSFCPVGCPESGMSSCSSMMCMLSLFQGERRRCCSSPCLCECVPHVPVKACATCPFPPQQQVARKSIDEEEEEELREVSVPPLLPCCLTVKLHLKVRNSEKVSPLALVSPVGPEKSE